jgi:hypothetical protein
MEQMDMHRDLGVTKANTVAPVFNTAEKAGRTFTE